MAARDPDGRIGTVLDGRYRIIEPLSRGGMGVVYRAERIPVGRPVAVKFLHALFAEDPDSRARFERETRALARLAHPHCVSIIDFGFDGAPYLVMELVAGVTLRELLDDGPLPVAEALTVTRQLLAALAHAHAEGVIHRDVKPANIMVSDEIGTGRHARILDFGLARLGERGATTITQASIAIGTPSYMAPEQTRGEPVDARTDLYAVGVLLFEMVTGQRPFAADDTAALLEQHRSAPPPHLADVAPERTWPRGLDDVIQRALAKDPDDRWQSAVELAAALDRIDRGERVPTATAQRGRTLTLALVVLLLMAATATAAYVVMGRRTERAATDAAGPTAGAGSAAAGSAAAGGAAAVTSGAATGTGTDTGTETGTGTETDAGTETETGTDAGTGTGTETDAGTGADAGTATATDTGAAPGGAAAAGPVAVTDTDAAATVADAGTALVIDEDDIQLEPLPTADPEIEAVDPSPEPPSADDEPVAPPPPPPVAAPPPAPPRSVREALALARAGHRDLAISGLRALWKKRPGDADLPYVLGNLYHEQRWWSVAMEHYQAAIARAPAYRRNATLIRNVIAMLGSTRTRGKASWFLRKVVGAPAKAHLRTASKRHKSPAVRKQAAAVLRRF